MSDFREGLTARRERRGEKGRRGGGGEREIEIHA